MPFADLSSPAAKASQLRARRKFYAAHRESQIASAAKWNREHKARVNARAALRRSKKMAPERVLWWNARNRAKAQGIEFALLFSDIEIPALCPVLGIPLVIATGCAKPGSPSIDRFDPRGGYVRGNIRVISHKANTIKSNATIEEVSAVLRYMRDAP